MPVSELISYLKTLSQNDWNKKITDEWTVKDMIAHLVGWEKGDPGLIKSTWQTKEKPWFMKTKEYDAFNRQSVEYYKNFTPAELIAEWKKWRDKVKEVIMEIGEDKLRAHPDLFGWLFDQGANSHTNIHFKQIKKHLHP